MGSARQRDVDPRDVDPRDVDPRDESPGVVVFDFYGTLAQDIGSFHIDDVMAVRGRVLPDHLREMWWSGDLDGQEHPDASRSREHYTAWQHERLQALLDAADIHPGER